MDSMITSATVDGFNRSLEELLHFADSLKLREKELEQHHILELEKIKADYDIQLQIEKKRVEQLQEWNRKLTDDIGIHTKKQIELEQKYTILHTKYDCCVEESKQIKEQNNKKNIRIEELEKIVRMLSNEKTRLDGEIEQLKKDNKILADKIKEIPPSPPPTTTSQQPINDEVIQLVEKAIAENNQLKSLLSERDNEILKLNEQIKRNPSEDPQVVEQRLLQLIAKLKSDFRTMYENQSNFFIQKLDLLKQEQRDNIASLYKT